MAPTGVINALKYPASFPCSRNETHNSVEQQRSLLATFSLRFSRYSVDNSFPPYPYYRNRLETPPFRSSRRDLTANDTRGKICSGGEAIPRQGFSCIAGRLVRKQVYVLCGPKRPRVRFCFRCNPKLSGLRDQRRINRPSENRLEISCVKGGGETDRPGDPTDRKKRREKNEPRGTKGSNRSGRAPGKRRTKIERSKNC